MLVVNSGERKKPPTSRQYDNIKLDLQEIGWEVVDWTPLAEVRDK
jgi:hypothetical protein